MRLPFDIHLPGKGSFWTVDFSKGEGYKRPRKRGKKAENAEDAPEKEGASTSASGSKSGRRRLLQEKSPMALAWEAQSTEFRVRDRPGRVNRAHAPFMPYPTAEARLAPRHPPTSLPPPPQTAPSIVSPPYPHYPADYSIPEQPTYPPLPPTPSSMLSLSNYYRSKTHNYPGIEADERAPQEKPTPGPYAATRWEGARSAYAERSGTSTEPYNPSPAFSIYDGPFAPPPRQLSPPSDARREPESEIEDEDEEEAEGEREYFQPSRASYQAYHAAWRTAERSTSASASGSSDQPITPVESFERSSNRELPSPRVNTFVSREDPRYATRDDSISPPPTPSNESAWRSSLHRYARSASRSTISSREISPLSDAPESASAGKVTSPSEENSIWSRRRKASRIEIPDVYRQDRRCRT